jgi:hypothetical protein
MSGAGGDLRQIAQEGIPPRGLVNEHTAAVGRVRPTLR